MAALTAYRVTLSDGTSYVTSMAAGVTLSDARAYFMGQVLVDECPESGRETRRAVIDVESADNGAGRAFWIYGTNRPVDAAERERDALREALGWFLVDDRFQVAVGGNPNVVEAMLDKARRALKGIDYE